MADHIPSDAKHQFIILPLPVGIDDIEDIEAGVYVSLPIRPFVIEYEFLEQFHTGDGIAVYVHFQGILDVIVAMKVVIVFLIVDILIITSHPVGRELVSHIIQHIQIEDGLFRVSVRDVGIEESSIEFGQHEYMIRIVQIAVFFVGCDEILDDLGLIFRMRLVFYSSFLRIHF